MPNLIYIKIDVTKIDKARLFEGKNGAKYLDLVCVPTTNSQYGDTHFITQSCSKEERQAGKKMPIVGNAKEQPPRGEQQQRRSPANQTPPPSSQKKASGNGTNDSDEPPF